MIVIFFLFFRISIQGETILILLSGDYTELRKAKEAFIEKLQENHTKLIFKEFVFKVDELSKLDNMLTDTLPDLIISFGNSATSYIYEKKPPVPIIFSMLSYKGDYPIQERLPDLFTGVTMNIDEGTTLEILIKLFGRQWELTTLYSENFFSDVNRIKEEAQKREISFSSYVVYNSRQIPSVLRKIRDKTLFWVLPDPSIYSKSILVDMFRPLNQKQAIILVPSYIYLKTDPGAHVAINIDAQSIGIQTANLVSRVLRYPAQRFPREVPEEIYIYLKKDLKKKYTITDLPNIKWVE